ncbi:Odorant-binding protein 83a [Carabus blaptoides fortunei]
MVKLLSVLVAVLCAVTLVVTDDEEYPPPELHEIIDPLHEMCTKKIGVSDAEVSGYQISDQTPKMMCYMECLMKESKWMSSDGVIQYDTIKEFSHPKIRELLLEALKNCMNIDAGTKDCELSYNFNVCIQKADPKHWFLP